MNSDDLKDNYQIKKLLKLIAAWKSPKENLIFDVQKPLEEDINKYCQKMLSKLRETKKSFITLALVQSKSKVRELIEKPEEIILNFHVVQVAIQIFKHFLLNPEFDNLSDLRVELIRMIVKVFELAQKKDGQEIRDHMLSEIMADDCLYRLLDYIFHENIFSIKSSFGIYNYREEALYITLETLIITAIQRQTSDSKKECFLSKIVEKEPKNLEYFPMNTFIFAISQRKIYKNDNVLERFFRIFMNFVIPKNAERIRFFFGFLKNYWRLLSERETADSTNKIFQIIEISKIFDPNVVKLLFTLANSIVHFPVKNVVDFIIENNKKYNIITDLLKDLADLLLKIDLTCLKAIEINPEISSPDFTGKNFKNKQVQNRILLISFVMSNFNGLNVKGKKRFLEQLVLFLVQTTADKCDVRASLLIFIVRDIFTDSLVELFPICLEIRFLIHSKFKTQFSEKFNEILCKSFFEILCSKIWVNVFYSNFQKWFDFFRVFFVRNPIDFLILVPYFFLSLIEKPRNPNYAKFYFNLLFLVQILQNFGDFPLLTIKNDAFDASKFNFNQIGNLKNLLEITTISPCIISQIFLTGDQIKERKVELEFFIFYFLFTNKFRNLKVCENFIEHLLKLFVNEFLKEGISVLFLEICDVVYYLSHFTDNSFFRGSFLSAIDAMFTSIKGIKTPEISQFETKINHILKQALIFCKFQQIGHKFLNTENLKFLTANYPKTAMLFGKIMCVIFSKTKFASKTSQSEIIESNFLSTYVLQENMFIQVDTQKSQIEFCDLFAHEKFQINYKYIINSPEIKQKIDSTLTHLLFNNDFPNYLINPNSKKCENNQATQVAMAYIASSEYKNIFKLGLLFIDKSAVDWNSVYAEKNSSKSQRYQIFLNNLISEMNIENNCLAFESLFDVYRFYIGQFFNESEIFEKRRFIGNSPFLILFNEDHEDPIKIEGLITEFNVFVVVISLEKNDFYSIRIKHNLKEKVQSFEIETLFFSEHEIIQVLYFTLLKYSKYVNELIFQEQSYAICDQNYFSNALSNRMESFEKLFYL